VPRLQTLFERIAKPFSSARHQLSQRFELPRSLVFLAPQDSGDLIRVGRPFDGGYVIPRRAIQSSKVLLSFGLSRDWSFEEHFARLNGNLTVHAYDHTVSLGVFIAEFFGTIPKILLFRKGVRTLLVRARVILSYLFFFKSSDLSRRHHIEKLVGSTVDGEVSADLAKSFSRLDPSEQLVFIKMDIEGSEYEVLKGIKPWVSRITGMAIEFHDTGLRRAEFLCLVRQIMQDFQVVHFHGNNCAGLSSDNLPESIEITFLSRLHFSVNSMETVQSLPRAGLDMPNDPKRMDPEFFFAPERSG